MIKGRVSDDWEPLVTVALRGADGSIESIECLVDTGFNGQIVLPAALIQRLKFPFHSVVTAEVGDGRRVNLPRYTARVLRGDAERPVMALAAEGGPAIGMRFLRRQHLSIEVQPAGRVTLAPL